MKPAFLTRWLLFLIAVSVLVSGCASNQPKSTKRYVWPRPPEQPRIEWIKSYYGENDFPKSGFTVFIETILGTPPALRFDKPIDIKSNGKGKVYVTDVSLSGIFVFDLLNYKVDFWKKGSDPDAGLAINPYFIALDDKDNIYSVGTGRNEIFILNPFGGLLRRIDYTDKVNSPGGIVVDSKGGRIYLVDTGDSKVVVFTVEGKYLFSFGKKGDANGDFLRPVPVTMNSKGEIIVGDVGNGRVQIFDKDGKFLRKIGQRGDGNADLQIIKGVSVDSDDNVYVTDGKANQIKVYDTNGNFLIGFGVAYSVSRIMKEAPGGFLLPQGIHIDANDSIFISDQGNMRFQHFRYLKDLPNKAGGIKQ